MGRIGDQVFGSGRPSMKLNAEWQRSPAQGMAGSEPPSGSRGFTGSAGRISYASGCSAVSVRFSQVCFPLYRVSNLDSVMSSHWSGTWPSRLTADCDDPVRDSCLAPPPTAYSGLLHQVDLVLRAPPRRRQTHIPSSRCTSRGDGATLHSTQYERGRRLSRCVPGGLRARYHVGPGPGPGQP